MNEYNLSASTILIVDDESDTLNVLLDALDQAQFTTFVATDGETALQQLANVTPLPDLILLDVMMPGIDGFETCRRLKANAAARDIPVLFMTALTETVNKVKGFEAGGVDYISKPFQIEEVLARVNAHLTIRKLQTALQTKNAQLEELNASKDKFFAIIAHDLKNPLVGFLSLAKLLEQGTDHREQDEFKGLVGQFRESAQNLLALLENLLLWSRLQRRSIEPFLQEIPIGAFAVQNMKLLAPNAAQKQIRLTNLVQEEIPVAVDVMMIDTVVRNLLSNAIKFTEAGGAVTISATQAEDTVTVSVSDTGIGIPAEKVPNLFRIDARCQRAGTADEKGTGLGLILCKEFVEKNRGQIWVASEVGKGTTVRFTLPTP
jgi:two-component system sensor histidine kinase/response regulator